MRQLTTEELIHVAGGYFSGPPESLLNCPGGAEVVLKRDGSLESHHAGHAIKLVHREPNETPLQSAQRFCYGTGDTPAATTGNLLSALQ